MIPVELDSVTSWREEALCRDLPEVDFFPTPEDTAAIKLAQEVCAACPVARECLEYAIETRQIEGIWGGHTPKERIKVRRLWQQEIRRAS
jgi:hypothetical protein